MLIDLFSRSDREIIERYNMLCWQFENNGKYTIPLYISALVYSIPESENVSEKLSKDEDAYVACYYQNGDENKRVWFKIYKPQYDWGKNDCKIVMYYDNKYNEANGEDL